MSVVDLVSSLLKRLAAKKDFLSHAWDSRVELEKVLMKRVFFEVLNEPGPLKIFYDQSQRTGSLLAH